MADSPGSFDALLATTPTQSSELLQHPPAGYVAPASSVFQSAGAAPGSPTSSELNDDDPEAGYSPPLLDMTFHFVDDTYPVWMPTPPPEPHGEHLDQSGNSPDRRTAIEICIACLTELAREAEHLGCSHVCCKNHTAPNPPFLVNSPRNWPNHSEELSSALQTASSSGLSLHSDASGGHEWQQQHTSCPLHHEDPNCNSLGSFPASCGLLAHSRTPPVPQPSIDNVPILTSAPSASTAELSTTPLPSTQEPSPGSLPATSSIANNLAIRNRTRNYRGGFDVLREFAETLGLHINPSLAADIPALRTLGTVSDHPPGHQIGHPVLTGSSPSLYYDALSEVGGDISQDSMSDDAMDIDSDPSPDE